MALPMQEAFLTRSLHRALAVVVLAVSLLSWWGYALFTTGGHSEAREPALFDLFFSMTVYSIFPAFLLLGTTLYAAVVRRRAGEAVAGIAVLVLMFLLARNGLNMMEFYD
ncbi:hypothetical protein GCM10028822_31690 [Hymenobacter terrigena]